MTLRITAEHADVWHAMGNLETMRHKCAVLDDWCAKVGRDPAAIERSVTVTDFDRLEAQAEEMVEAGAGLLVISRNGPEYDLAPLRQLVAWRDRNA